MKNLTVNLDSLVMKSDCNAFDPILLYFSLHTRTSYLYSLPSLHPYILTMKFAAGATV